MSNASALEAAPEGLRLENYANNSTPPLDAAAVRRSDRWITLAKLWRISKLERVRKCGRVLRGSHVEYRKSGEMVGLSGLCSCGSVWVCPRCNSKVMARRAFELGALIASAQSQGFVAVEITLTLRHSLTDDLATLWSTLSHCWDRARNGKVWSKDCERFGVLGWLRVVEVTDGRNGWHPHLHGVVFVREIDAEGVNRLASGMFGRWQRAAVRQGLEAPELVGQEWHVIGEGGDSKISQYLTEAKTYGSSVAIGLELTQTQSKQARSMYATRSTWDLLDDAINGEVRALARWWEYEQASTGKRQISYSRHLREVLGVNFDDLTDDEIADEEVGSADDAGVIVTPAGWNRMAGNPDWIPASLEVLQKAGWSALSDFLTQRGVQHQRVSMK